MLTGIHSVNFVERHLGLILLNFLFRIASTMFLLETKTAYMLLLLLKNPVEISIFSNDSRMYVFLLYSIGITVCGYTSVKVSITTDANSNVWKMF